MLFVSDIRLANATMISFTSRKRELPGGLWLQRAPLLLKIRMREAMEQAVIGDPKLQVL